jgi:hypothetical protein
MRIPPRLFAILLCVQPLLAHAAWKLTVEAGDFDRAQTIVTFEGMPAGDYVLREKSGGAAVPVQASEGRGVYVEAAM